MPHAGKTRDLRAIQGHKVLQALRALKVFKGFRARRDKLGLRVLRGRKALPARKERGVKKERKETRATKAIPVEAIREKKETGARRVKRAIQVQQSALSKSMDR